jgi:DedD protein
MAFFKIRKSAQNGADASAAAVPQPQSIELMRRRAKHRLIGAAVLVLLGVVGFPLLFDTQPRPVQVDIPIEIPDKAKVKPLVMPPSVEAVASAPVVPAAPEPAASATPVAEAKPAAVEDAPASVAPQGRFVVQVGAFSDAAKLREVRQKLEKSGLKTYTQVVDTKDGKRTRVRVGPFASQGEADKVASRIKSLALSASVLKM